MTLRTFPYAELKVQGYRATRISLQGDAHLEALSYRLDDLQDAVARIYLLAQAQDSQSLERVDISCDRASIAAQFFCKGGDTQLFLADDLPETEALYGEAFGHVQRVGKGDDFFGLEGDALFTLRCAMQ